MSLGVIQKGDEYPDTSWLVLSLGSSEPVFAPTGRDRTTRQTAASEPKGVNAPEDMQLSAYGQGSLVLGGTIPES